MQEKVIVMNSNLCKFLFMLNDVLTNFNKKLLEKIHIIT